MKKEEIGVVRRCENILGGRRKLVELGGGTRRFEVWKEEIVFYEK